MRPRRRAAILLAVSLAAGPAALSAAQAGGDPPSPGSPIDPRAVSQRIDEAEAARQMAAGRGAEWLETRDLIQEARSEAERENLQQAMALAERALQQGKLAVAQAERESRAWRDRVVR